jgi:hypothetical protein
LAIAPDAITRISEEKLDAVEGERMCRWEAIAEGVGPGK